MIPEKLIRLAHRRAVVQQLLYDMKEKYVAEDGKEARSRIVCEDIVPQNQRHVPEDTVLDVLHLLQQLDESLTKDISLFRVVEEQPQKLPTFQERKKTDEKEQQAAPAAEVEDAKPSRRKAIRVARSTGS